MDKTELLTKLVSFEHPEFHWVREYPRIKCYLLVDFASKGKIYRSCIRDMSASGAFIETSELFEIGQEVALCFSISESNESLPFKIKGKVSRIYPDGIGVEYKNITQYQREIINTLLRKIS
jgi:Tfp pilus assembly protein PilZ